MRSKVLKPAETSAKLHELAREGDQTNLEAELRFSRGLEVRDEQGFTPLMVAVASSRAGVNVVRCLIEHGADVNAVSTPPPPLADARAALERAGVDASFLDEANRTPDGDSVLSLAVEYASLAKIEVLVKHGADAKWTSASGYSVLLKTLFRKVDTTDDERRAILEALIAARAPLDAVSRHGESVLSVAARTADVGLVKFFLEHGADASALCWNEVFRAIAFGDEEDLAALLRTSPSLEDVDGWGRTPFLFAVHCGRLEMARRLIEHGCDRSAVGRAGSTAVACAIEGNRPQILQWLLANGWDLRTPVDEFNLSALRHAVQCDHPDCVRLLIKAGAEIHEEDECGFGLLHETLSPEVVWILHAAGLELDGLPSVQRVGLLPVGNGQPFDVSPADYQAFCAPRFGRSNPEEMGNSFWNEMVRIRCNAYTARKRFGDGPRLRPNDQPLWCFERFGQSLTRLPCGQLVEIGGEHEDYYDPDFCIYNDVVVHDGQGSFRIFGYPKEIFPPTDFHSATFLDGSIYVIGSLGYPADRRTGETPVFRLSCETWRIEPIPSVGDTPGWIHGHRARAEGNGQILVGGGMIWDGEDLVDNRQTFCFDTRTGHWRVADVP
ncbi:MAG: ankyrin repeat domain-containing protein [Pirellulaceae bacterium]|nr:ankyrin repeat domain-containing protein [Pirellulaceae bacterium]